MGDHMDRKNRRALQLAILMVLLAVIGAAAIIGYAKCEQAGGCYLLTGAELEAAGQAIFMQGAQTGYAVGLAGCKAKGI